MDFDGYVDRDEPLSSIDLAFKRVQTGHNGGVNKRLNSARPRGRPKRARRDESEGSESSESDHEETVVLSPEGSSGDENDPDWKKGLDLGKTKRAKRINYNVKSLMQAEMGKAGTPGAPRGRGRPRGSYKSVSAPRLGQVMMDDSEKKELDFFNSKLPDPDNDLPTPDCRVHASQMDRTDAVRNASGGFKHFVRAVDDATVIPIYTHVNSRYKFPEETNDVMQIVQCLRHLWNSLPNATRRKWEIAARQKASENFKNGVTEVENDNYVPASLDDLIKHVQETATNESRDYALMPMCEMPFKSDAKWPDDVIIPHCCPDSPPLKNFEDVKKHFLTKHYTGYLYACQFCNQLHESKEQLLKHSCPGFSDYMIQRLIAGVLDDPEMKCAYIFLTCYECGFWLPIRGCYKGDRLEQAWNFFVKINEHHSGESLNLLVIFSFESIKEEDKANFVINIVPRTMSRVPTECNECKIEFTSLEKMNEHMLEHVQLKCTKCNAEFGTKAHLIYHLAGHLQSKITFARYLRDQMTVYPPVHAKNAMPRIGFKKSDNVAFGGKEFTEENLYEFIQSDEPLIDEKLNNALHAKPLADYKEEPAGSSSTQARHDMGLEEVKQLSSPTPEQAHTIDMLNKLFAKQMTEKRKLHWNAYLWKETGLKQSLYCEEDADDEKEVKAKEIVCPTSSLAEDLIKTFSISVKLPSLAVFDAISEGVLITDYDLCTNCRKIYEKNGTFAHDCSEEDIFPIYRWENGNRKLVNCHLCKESFCSLFALKGHYAFDHLRCIELHPMSNKVNLMTVAMKTLLKGSRSLLAKNTDAALHMEDTFGILKPKPTAPQQIPIGQVPRRAIGDRPGSYVVPSQKRTFYPNGQSRTVYRPQIIPFGFPLDKSSYYCKFCTFSAQDMRRLREHLRTNHTIICRGCGHAFSHQKTLIDHDRRCSKTFKVSMGSIHGTCICCNRVESLPRLYTHIFEAHMNLVSYGSEDGRIYKRDTTSLFVKNIYGAPPANQINSHIPSKAKNSFSTPDNVNCYLCAFEFDTMPQLREHLNRHPERWDECPFCVDVPISSHEDFRIHLLSAHYDHADNNSMGCKLCNAVFDKNNVAHILYQCVMSKKCAFCKPSALTPRREFSQEELRVHWRMKHPDLFNRFQCSECKLLVPQLQYIKNHTCKIFDMSHQCACGVSSPTRSAFVDHFWIHVDSFRHTCKVCGFRFTATNTVTSHRLIHSTVVGKSSNRKIKIVDEELFTGKAKTEVMPVLKPVRPMAAGVEVVELNDDDDEEDPGTPPSLHSVSNNTTESTVLSVIRNLVKEVCEEMGEEIEEQEEEADALTASVRTESDEITVVNEYPGYIDEDTECPSPSTPSTTLAGVLRQITEVSADDDICVVAEVDHPTGSCQSNVVASTAREKKYKCTMCSQSFVTHASLMDHEIKSHRNDVGGICEKVYGVPMEGTYYVCRNCCAAFENSLQFRRHVQAHGPNAGISCPECSGISYNMPLFNQHQLCHQRRDKGKLMFGCGTCLKMFQTDARLYHHLNNVHQVPLLFFCKCCSVTSFLLVTILDHINNTNACRGILQRKGFKINQMFGIFPACLVHFQPANPDLFDLRVKQGTTKLLTPSDCTHRSFLTLTDSVISCKECNCTMSSVAFQANEAYKNGGASLDLSRMIFDESREFPFPVSSIQGKVNPYIQVKGQPGRPPVRAMYQQPNHLRSHLPYPNSLAGIKSNLQRGGAGMAQKYPGVASAARGYTVQTKPITTVPHNDDITVVERYSVVRPPTNSSVAKNGQANTKCELCNAALNNPKVRRLHELHKSDHEWFCLNCATGQKHEVDAISHCFTCNFNEEKRKALTSQTDIRLMSFSLLCPFDSCRKGVQKEYFKNLTGFKAHINKVHCRDLPYTSGCGLRFANNEMLEKHEAEHARYEELGVETSCCALCGIANQWNLTTSICGPNTIISHVATHGLYEYSMCRGCFTCFQNDYDWSKTVKHFESTHTQPASFGNIRCNSCELIVRKDQLRTHVIEKHVVHGYKARYNASHQLTVRTSGVTRLFMGMPLEDFEEEPETA